MKKGHFDEQGKKNTNKSGRGGKTLRRRKTFMLIAELLAIVLVLVAVSYAPQLIFQVQDRILCGKTELGERESMDVEALSTTYELSLAKRMTNFAEGMASGDKYYVTSKELAVGQALYDYLDSSTGLYKSLLINLVEGALLNDVFLSGIQDLEVSQWKQYVIYSDNYAKGVNFILWYIELNAPDGERLKLLVDAETKTLYALKTEENIHVPKNIGRAFRNRESLIAFWCYFATVYEAVADTEVNVWAERLYEEVERQSDEITDSYGAESYAIDGYISVPYSKQEAEAALDYVYVKENLGFQSGVNDFCFTLPFGEEHLDVDILLDEADVYYNYYGSSYYYVYPNITLGVRQIYELIPEFA